MSVEAHFGRKKGCSSIARCLLACVALYRVTLGYLLGGHCRFVPSCSRYAQVALRRHGAWQGTQLIVRRLLSCHPWHCGGVDEVPATVAVLPNNKGMVLDHSRL